jgi:CheY-like chemotaxis protein
MAKILVIDDDSAVRETIVQILECEGYRVLAAANGRAGLDLFRSEQPDLVITDMIMPEQLGADTMSAIKREQPDAKIIAMSGSDRIGETYFLDLALQVGAIATIVKPFDPDELIERVRSCVSSDGASMAA